MYKYTYPITSKFQQFLIDNKLIEERNESIDEVRSMHFIYIGPEHLQKTIISMHEYLGEAEHGGDIQELYRDQPSMYKRYHELYTIVNYTEELHRDNNLELINNAEAELQELTIIMLNQLRATYQDLILFIIGSN